MRLSPLGGSHAKDQVCHIQHAEVLPKLLSIPNQWHQHRWEAQHNFQGIHQIPLYLLPKAVRLFIQLLQHGASSVCGTKAIELQQQIGKKCLLAPPLAHPCLYIKVSVLAVLWENENLEVLDFSHNPSNWNMLIIIVSASLLLLL